MQKVAQEAEVDLECPVCGGRHEYHAKVWRGIPVRERPGTPMVTLKRRFPVEAFCPKTQKRFTSEVELPDLPLASPIYDVEVLD
jgi:hypothetical protein